VTQVGEAFVEIKADLSGFERTVQTGVASAMKDIERQVDKASKRIGDSLQEAGKKIGDVGKKMSDLGGDLTKKVTLPIVGVGTAAVGAASTVDKALRDIRVGTGATGEALDQLEDDFRVLARNSSRGIDRVGTVVADLNTRLGLTGEPMQELAGQVLNLEQILGGTEVSLDTLTRVFGAFRVEPERYSTVLDQLFRASQATGVEFNQLQNLVVGQSAAFGELGFGLEDTIAILGQFEKAGVNTETVLGGLRVSIGKAAAEGKDAATFFRDGVKRIEEFIASGDEAGAQAEARELFGARTFLDALDAIRRGQFNIDDTVDQIVNGADTIDVLASETAQFGDQFAKFKNQMTLSLAPLGEKLIPLLTQALEKLVPMIDRAITLFTNLSPRVKMVIGVAVALAAALGPLLIIVGKVVSVVGLMVVGVGKLIPVIALLFTPVGAIVLGIAALVAIIIIVIKNFDSIRDAIAKVVDAIGDFISGALQAIKNAFTALWELIRDVWDKITGAIESAISFIVDTAFAVFRGALDGIMTVFGVVKDFITQTIDAIASVIGAVFGQIANVITGVMDVIKTVISGAFTFILDLFTKYLNFYRDLVRTVFNAIRTIIRTVLNAIKAIITRLFDQISDVFFTALSAIQTLVSNIFGFIQDIVHGAMSFITDIIVGALNGIKAVFETIWNGITQIVREVLNTIKGIFESIWNGLKTFVIDVVGGIVGFIKDRFDDLVRFFAGIPGRISDIARGMFDGIREAFRGALNFIIRGWNSLNFRIPGFRVGPIGYDGFTLGLPKIPELANGGIITQPTLALVGEAGPEAVIPLTRPTRARELASAAGLVGNSGPLVNIAQATFMDGTDADLVAQRVNSAYRARVLVA